jgi:hypothetical protein
MSDRCDDLNPVKEKRDDYEHNRYGYDHDIGTRRPDNRRAVSFAVVTFIIVARAETQVESLVINRARRLSQLRELVCFAPVFCVPTKRVCWMGRPHFQVSSFSSKRPITKAWRSELRSGP